MNFINQQTQIIIGGSTYDVVPGSITAQPVRLSTRHGKIGKGASQCDEFIFTGMAIIPRRGYYRIAVFTDCANAHSVLDKAMLSGLNPVEVSRYQDNQQHHFQQYTEFSTRNMTNQEIVNKVREKLENIKERMIKASYSEELVQP